MSNETTPAIERGSAIGPMAYTQAMTDPEVPHVWRYVSGAILTTALTDPDDPDALARTLFVLHHEATGWLVGPQVFDASPSRKQWRAVADGLRAALLGTVS